MDDHIDIVFDGPPAQEMPRLVEVDSGSSSPVVLVGSARLLYPQKRKCGRAVHDGEKVPIAADIRHNVYKTSGLWDEGKDFKKPHGISRR